MKAHFGDTRQRCDVAGFRLQEVSFPPWAEVPLHAHDAPQFTMVACGSLIEVGQMIGRNVAPTGAAFRPAGYLHRSNFSDAETLGLVVEITDERLPMLANLFDTSAAQYTQVPRLGSIFHRIHTELAGSGPARAIALEAAILDFTVSVARSLRPLIDEITAAIDRDPARRWDLMSIAGAVAATVDDIEATIDRPLASFVLSRRVEVARRMLIESDAPIASIATAAGFFDQAHLTRAVVRATGRTPRALRLGAAVRS